MKKEKVVIVTGAAGFLGNNVIRKLQKEDFKIRAFILPNDQGKSLEGLNCKIYKGDVTKKETLKEVFTITENQELYVIHCAAIVYIKSKYNPLVYEVNVSGTKNIIEKVLETNAKLVYVSSVHAIPEKKGVITEITDFNPDKVEGLYAKTKAEIASYILKMTKEKDLNACIVHPSGIIGPYDFGATHLTQMILDFASGRLTAAVRGGYDFVDVRDVADGIINAMEKGKKGECYLLTNHYVEVKELLDEISELRNTKKIKTILPMWIAKLTAPLSELYYKILNQPPLYTKYSLYTLTSSSNFSNQKAKKELGFKNREIKETIKDTLMWLEEQGRINKKKEKKEILILLIQMFMFYIFPLFAGPTDTMGMVFIIFLMTFILSILMGSISNQNLKYFYPIIVSILFIPSIFIYYNSSALIHTIWYLTTSIIGIAIGIEIDKVTKG